MSSLSSSFTRDPGERSLSKRERRCSKRWGTLGRRWGVSLKRSLSIRGMSTGEPLPASLCLSIPLISLPSSLPPPHSSCLQLTCSQFLMLLMFKYIDVFTLCTYSCMYMYMYTGLSAMPMLRWRSVFSQTTAVVLLVSLPRTRSAASPWGDWAQRNKTFSWGYSSWRER